VDFGTKGILNSEKLHIRISDPVSRPEKRGSLKTHGIISYVSEKHSFPSDSSIRQLLAGGSYPLFQKSNRSKNGFEGNTYSAMGG
jgi:hypothetical protein